MTERRASAYWLRSASYSSRRASGTPLSADLGQVQQRGGTTHQLRVQGRLGGVNPGMQAVQARQR